MVKNSGGVHTYTVGGRKLEVSEQHGSQWIDAYRLRIFYVTKSIMYENKTNSAVEIVQYKQLSL